MKTKTQLKNLLYILIVAISALIYSEVAPEIQNGDQMLATGAVAAAMLFNAGNLSSWRQRVEYFMNANGKNPDNYPIEWSRIVAEAQITTATTRFQFFLKEDPNQARGREVRLGLNDVFFGFASQFRMLNVTTATPFNAVPVTSPIAAALNVFYETGNITLGSGNVNVWSKHSLAHYRYAPGQSASELSGTDGVNLCYPAPILSGRNDLQCVLDIATPDAAIVNGSAGQVYVLQFSFIGYRIVGLAKDIETSTYFV
jgi:hypothetical protein